MVLTLVCGLALNKMAKRIKHLMEIEKISSSKSSGHTDHTKEADLEHPVFSLFSH